MERILVVCHHTSLRQSRVSILAQAGYRVVSVSSDNEAMELLETERFGLILIGKRSTLAQRGLGDRLREKYPFLPILKIQSDGATASDLSIRSIDSYPGHVLAAIKEMLATDRPEKSASQDPDIKHGE